MIANKNEYMNFDPKEPRLQKRVRLTPAPFSFFILPNGEPVFRPAGSGTLFKNFPLRGTDTRTVLPSSHQYLHLQGMIYYNIARREFQVFYKPFCGQVKKFRERPEF